jgi:hypothetical protein
MIKLSGSLYAWGSPDFGAVIKSEIQNISKEDLPLQQGLTHSSNVGASNIRVVVLNTQETADYISVKTGIFYSGIIAGSCCADDPTPVDEQTEYCEIQFDIDKNTAETHVTLL